MKNNTWIAILGRRHPSFYAVLYFFLIPFFALIFSYAPDVALKCQDNDPCGFFQKLYFSTATITTLGYGDITPKGAGGQLVAGLEALLGIVTIGLFLNSLSYSIGSAAQELEAASQERARHLDEVARLRSFASIVSIYLSRYRLYAYLVTTPLTLRPGVQVVSPKDGETVQIELPKFEAAGQFEIPQKKNFIFNDLKDLFKPSLRLSDDYSRSTAFYYFSAQDNLLSAVRNLMLGVDLSKWPELAHVCRELIETSIELDWREAILKLESVATGPNSMKGTIEKMIEEWQGEPKFLPSNVINAYVALYMLIRKNLETLDQYEIFLNTALNS
ncbi:potassium channel family protein [Burkholderia sp. PU8-34]